MPAIEVGRICTVTAGREVGKKCVIVDITDKAFVTITGPKALTGIKRKRANIAHIMPLEGKLEIKKGASDDEVTQALNAANKTDEMKQPQKAATQ